MTDGKVEVAVGLGKYIVDGGMSLRFSPRHPAHVLQTSTLDLALRDTQRYFYALSTTAGEGEFSIDEGFDIARLNVDDAGKQGFLKYLVSTYDFQNERIVDSDEGGGRKVVTFANVLRHDVFPLAQSLDFMLTKGQQEMGRPVEIEFAGVLGTTKEIREGNKGTLYWLQIRPMVDRREMLDEHVLNASPDQLLISSNNALGHGMMDGVQHVVMVKPEKFSMANNVLIAEEIAKINRNFTDSGEGYILVGVGRWGSSDTALGIPVKWPQISSARLIVEVAAPGNTIEPSQGTHFFQNLTSFGVGYFTEGMKRDAGMVDFDYLAAMPAVYESEFVRIVRFDSPLQVAINGMKGRGVVMKPHAKQLDNNT